MCFFWMWVVWKAFQGDISGERGDTCEQTNKYPSCLNSRFDGNEVSPYICLCTLHLPLQIPTISIHPSFILRFFPFSIQLRIGIRHELPGNNWNFFSTLEMTYAAILVRKLRKFDEKNCNYGAEAPNIWPPRGKRVSTFHSILAMVSWH